MNYINTIKTACIYFPFIALLFTIPFILHQYHKYGSINKLRVIIVYSFILYLICIYFLVILPLPNIKTMTPPKDNMIRLIPFGFILDIINETTFRFNVPSTYLKSLIDPCIYTVVFNIIMTIPFGIYLRYYFKLEKKKIIMFTFLLSLFFEFTQVSRLYFIYPYQYRVFDVDDLITNTFGGVVGYYLSHFIVRFLPSRDKIDKDSYMAGVKVSGLRRISLFCFDFALCFLITANSIVLTNKNFMFLVIFIVYYMLIPLLFKEKQTLGSKFLNVKVEYRKYRLVIDFFRNIFLYMYYLVIPFILIRLSNYIVIKLNIDTHESILIYLITLFIIMLYWLLNILYLIKKDYIYYDKIFKAKYISTIKIKDGG